jgi:hypothetical protein
MNQDTRDRIPFDDLPRNRTGVGWHQEYPPQLLPEAWRWLRSTVIDRYCLGVYVDTSHDGPLPIHPYLPRVFIRNRPLGFWSKWISLGFAVDKAPKPTNDDLIRRHASRATLRRQPPKTATQ